ncbi:tyrosine-type recombinase/integrase [Victivallis sp. Marseille-Q1083]|uniref:tyrosine-type recombinase/integrase n=1 Tax=Victivallis sp. Marseille-Q1083 TaxID=2717288 RepID=UPI00158F418C|nr:tyrosine-type recombinase/integrase [Victivallis sp. Marseille-Q1083]
MALRQRGKENFYHAYFRTIIALPDGRLKYATTTVNLGTSDLVTARALEADLLRKNKAARLHQRAKAPAIRLDVAAGVRPAADIQTIHRERRKRRLKLADALAVAEKYKSLGETTEKRFRAFCKTVKLRYMDEVTPDIAFEYLCGKCPDTGNGKNFNNIKSALNAVFRLTLLDSGMDASPFAKIPNRSVCSRHQRPFTEDEFVRIYRSAPEPWKSAAMIAWFTGLREKDVFLLRWDQISGDVLTTLPAKTARFGRSVQIPIHPQLTAALAALPRVGDRVLGAWPYEPESISFRRAFGDLLRKLKICDDASGFVAFNSLRDSFVTRCDAAGIPRHAVRGLVGHVSDRQTDLYSHDLTSARFVQRLPSVKLEKSVKNEK